MYRSLEEICEAAEGSSFYEAVLADDCKERGIKEVESKAQMRAMYEAMKQADAGYEAKRVSASGLAGTDGEKLAQARAQKKLICGDLIGLVMEKAVKMAEMMKVPVLGLIENMSTYTCPDCGKQHAIFGESHLDSIAAEHHIPVLARLPIQPALASLMDTGTIELFEGDFMQPAADRLCALLPR